MNVCMVGLVIFVGWRVPLALDHYAMSLEVLTDDVGTQVARSTSDAQDDEVEGDEQDLVDDPEELTQLRFGRGTFWR